MVECNCRTQLRQVWYATKIPSHLTLRFPIWPACWKICRIQLSIVMFLKRVAAWFVYVIKSDSDNAVHVVRLRSDGQGECLAALHGGGTGVRRENRDHLAELRWGNAQTEAAAQEHTGSLASKQQVFSGWGPAWLRTVVSKSDNSKESPTFLHSNQTFY